MTDELDTIFDCRRSGIKYPPQSKEGKEVPVLICLAGFPDSASVWEPLISQKELQSTHHIVALGLPGMHRDSLPDDHRWGYSPMEILVELHKVVTKVQEMHPEKKPTIDLCAHDWGSIYAYIYVQQHPEIIRKFVSLDIGLMEANEMPFGNTLKTVAYFLCFALAFIVRNLISASIASKVIELYPWKSIGPMTSVDTRIFLQTPKNNPHTCYPYFQFIKGKLTKLDLKNPITFDKIKSVPHLFLFGTKKDINYHSSVFLHNLDQTPGCSWKSFDGGHWFYADPKHSQEVATVMSTFFQLG
ncbi:expressed unknown protein [Seminavis robusta]|uniref:AB hydrolase-1 domain-containing protein n=1 Tax=Seminavis robusta TaxID=568900 RepID=A0A9N8H3V5_9STRA|nr:expressed unknown protein [Seminavis robusta]|eukprot:Sro47_g027730.1 n/a (300) ;mRNA; f:39577-40476